VQSADPQDSLDAALRIVASLEARNVSYALGGALAYGLWAVPRATLDVDLNVFVEGDQLKNALEALTACGVSLDEAQARAGAEREGMFEGWLGPIRVDVFTPSIDFSREAERTRVRQRIATQDVWVLSPEALAVFKMLFFRTKDIADIERLIAVRADLDRAYVRRWLVTMMGEGDERVVRWDALVMEHGGA
jgi:hypothetical protein